MFFIKQMLIRHKANAARMQREIDDLKSDLEEARKLMSSNDSKRTVDEECRRVRLAGRAASLAKVEGISLKKIGTNAEEIFKLTRYYSPELMRKYQRTTSH